MLCYFIKLHATRLSLTTYCQVVELQENNKLLEQLVLTRLFNQQPCSKLPTSWEQAVPHPVEKLLEQHFYKSAAGLLQLARSYH